MALYVIRGAQSICYGEASIYSCGDDSDVAPISYIFSHCSIVKRLYFVFKWFWKKKCVRFNRYAARAALTWPNSRSFNLVTVQTYAVYHSFLGIFLSCFFSPTTFSRFELYWKAPLCRLSIDKFTFNLAQLYFALISLYSWTDNAKVVFLPIKNQANRWYRRYINDLQFHYWMPLKPI